MHDSQKGHPEGVEQAWLSLALKQEKTSDCFCGPVLTAGHSYKASWVMKSELLKHTLQKRSEPSIPAL